MSTGIHNAISDWLLASARGELTAAQRSLLAEHMTFCPECRDLACDVELLENVCATLTPKPPGGSEFVERVAERFRATVDPLPELPPLVSKHSSRRGWHVALGLVVVVLLAVRCVDSKGLYQGLSPSGVVSVIWQVGLRAPDYHGVVQPGEFLGTKTTMLAAVHALTSLCVDFLLWTTLLLMLGAAFLHACRRRCRQPV